MANFDKVILNGVQYDIPTGGGGGGTSYTAGAGIDITNNVITNTREQRVLIDEDDDTGLHSGFIVKSPHYKKGNTLTANLSNYSNFFENEPSADGDPYTQGAYLNGRMAFTITTVPEGVSVSIFGENDSYRVNGTYIGDGWQTINLTEGTYISFKNRAYFNDFKTYLEEETSLSSVYVSVDQYQWVNINTAYVVHSGQETQLADSDSVTTIVNSSIGSGMANGTNLGKFTKSFNFIGNANTGVVTVGASASSTQSNITLYNNVSRNDQNLTIGFDPTYSEQQTVTAYAYREGIDWNDFFGSGVYGGQWSGQTGTFVSQRSNNMYQLEIPVTNLSENLSSGAQIRFNAYDGQTYGTKDIYITMAGSQLKLATDNGTSGMTEMGNFFNLTDMVDIYVNDSRVNISSVETSGSTVTLIADISNLTSLSIVPTYSGNDLVTNMMLSGSIETPYNNTIWGYETTGTVTVQYQNHPEKLNHYIRYAGETGTAVGNRKAYILTDRNISQSDYITALVARIAALEACLDNYDGTGMTIESQYPGQAMSGVS